MKKDWKLIFFPPVWLVLGLSAVFTAALIWVFCSGREGSPAAYVIYVGSFYALTILCIACIKRFPGYYQWILQRIYANDHAKRYLTDAACKTHVNLYVSLGINLFYVATNVVSAVFYRSLWFAIFAVYYGIMAVMRFLLVRYVHENHIGESRLGELKRARTCAGILLTVNVVLSGVVLMMVYHDRGFEYRGFLIYGMALYTFYVTTMAVMNLIKYRKYQSPIMSVTKIIQLAASLFSMLFLETAMFSQFGQDTPAQTKRVMIMATGAGICVIVVTMSLYVIVRSTKELKK